MSMSGTFATNDELYLDPPELDSTTINPSNNMDNVQPIPTPPISVLFTLAEGTLSPGSLNTNVFYVYDNDFCVDPLGEGHKEEIHERVNTSENNCFPSYHTYMSMGNKQCNIVIHSNLKNLTWYRPRITSELKDSYGNCFNPAEDEANLSGQQ